MAKWIAEVAEALDYAHGLGVIHRDIKPSNLLLSVEGRMMVSDFGLAKAAGSESMTAPCALLGTARYMSPEQVDQQQGEVDRRSDVYALGATLYELLAFRPMFAAVDDREVLDHVLNREPPPPRRFVRQVPLELETICLKAVEKDSNKRYATAMALRDDLERWLLDLPIQAKRPSLPMRAAKFVRRRKVPTALAASLVVVLIATSFLYAGYRSSRHEALEAQSIGESRAVEVLYLEAQNALFQQGRYEVALAKIDEALVIEPESLKLGIARGMTLRHMKRPADAVACLGEVLARAPDSWKCQYVLAMAYDDLGDDAKAAYHHQQVELMNPDGAVAFYVRAAEEEDPAKAVELLNKALELEPNKTAFLIDRSWRYYELEQFDRMLPDVQRLVGAHPNWAFLQHHLGLALFNLERYADAEQAFGQALKLEPDNALTWNNRASSKLKMGRFAEALADVGEAVKLDPDYAPAYLCRSKARAGLGNLHEALADCGRSIKLDPTNLEAHLTRSYLYFQLGQVEDVIATNTKIIQMRPDELRGYANRGLSYIDTKQYARAVADFTQCVQLSPDDPRAYESRAVAYVALEQHALAVADLTRALELRPPGFAEDHRKRADCYIRIGEYEEALKDLTRAIVLEAEAKPALSVVSVLTRGMVHEFRGASQLALMDYQEVAEQGGPVGEYGQLWKYILLGLNDRDEAASEFLPSRRSRDGVGIWTDRLFDLFAGEMDSAELLTAAATDDERAEACYYIGMHALLKDEEDTAVDALQNCVALSRPAILETTFARARLVQLEGKQPAAPNP